MNFFLGIYVIFKNSHSVEQLRTLVIFTQRTLPKPTMETPEPCVKSVKR